jgi:Arc/MetJ-type ribon-helix-helix transcriptional regulator
VCFTLAMKPQEQRIECRITFSVDRALLDLVDEHAAEHFEQNRSIVIRRALREYLRSDEQAPKAKAPTIERRRAGAPRPKQVA